MRATTKQIANTNDSYERVRDAFARIGKLSQFPCKQPPFVNGVIAQDGKWDEDPNNIDFAALGIDPYSDAAAYLRSAVEVKRRTGTWPSWIQESEKPSVNESTGEFANMIGPVCPIRR